MKPAPVIWGLVDDRAGHTTQTLGLLEHLGVGFEKKQLTYNWFSALPNQFNRCGLAHLSKDSRKMVSDEFPDMVVGCGRRIAPVLRAMKDANPSVVTIYLMWPDNTDGLDLIIAPKHDNPPRSDQVFVTSAPFTTITEKGLIAARKTNWHHFAHLPKPWVSVCVGGSIRGMTFTMDDWRKMIRQAQALAKEGSLLVTTSRRTDMAVEEMLKREITGPSFLHGYHAGGQNPYMGFLACADAVCVSGDSVSMCAEATATGKPVFIFTPENAAAKKHLAQHQTLYDTGRARPLDHRARINWRPDYQSTDIEQAVAFIKQRFSHLFTQVDAM